MTDEFDNEEWQNSLTAQSRKVERELLKFAQLCSKYDNAPKESQRVANALFSSLVMITLAERVGQLFSALRPAPKQSGNVHYLNPNDTKH